MSAFAGVRSWIMGRSPRERLMLGLLAVAVVLFVGWLTVRPLWAWRAETAEARVDAARDLVEVKRAVAAQQQTPPAASRMPADQVEAAATRTAEAAGFQPVLEVGSDGVAFTADSVTSGVLFGWLSQLAGEGVQAVELTVTENADATLNAQGVVAGAT